jgi:hypothetical protein
MGDVSGTGNRAYPVFEDRAFGKYPEPGFRGYLLNRLAKGVRCGVKCSASRWMADPNPTTLPVEVLRIHRPLEESLRSSRRLWTEDRAHELAKEDHPTLFLAHRYAGLVRLWAAVQEIPIKPTLELDFSHVLQSPLTSVTQITAAFNLEPTRRQVEAAVEFVDPGKIHV